MKAADATSPVERQRVKDYSDQTLVTRLNDKANGWVLSIQQRLHEDDLAAHLIEGGRFDQLILRAIAIEDEAVPIGFGQVRPRKRGEPLWPERELLDVLERLRVEMGPTALSAQCQQDPLPGRQPGPMRVIRNL